MLSRLTNVVLMLAVIVLSIALARASRYSPPDAGLSNVRVIDAAFAAPADADDDLQSDIVPEIVLASASDGPRPRADRDDGTRSSEMNGSNAPRRGNHSRSMPILTEEMADRCVEVAREADPELGQRLAEARTTNPDEFNRELRSGSFGRRLMALAQLKTHDPHLYGDKLSELSWAIDIDRTARELRELRKKPEASLGEVAERETKLRTLVQMQQAMSIKARGEMICRFEERLERMKADLDREVRNFQSTVDARMRFLLEEPAAEKAEVIDAPPAASAG